MLILNISEDTEHIKLFLLKLCGAAVKGNSWEHSLGSRKAY